LKFGGKAIQSIELISKSCLNKIQIKIFNFLLERDFNNIYYTANFNNYSNTAPLIESVCARLGKPLIIFCDSGFVIPRNYLKFKNLLFITIDWNEKTDARLFAKIFKIMPHLFFPKTKVTTWLDSNISIKKDDVSLLFLLEDCDLVLFRHDKRNSVTEEYMDCLNFKKDSSKKLEEFSRFLIDNKDPGFLCQGRIIYRKTSVKVQKFNEIWWEYIQKGSIRDQLSLPYAISKSNVSTNILASSRLLELFRIYFHNKISYSHRSKSMNFLLSLRNTILKMRDFFK